MARIKPRSRPELDVLDTDEGAVVYDASKGGLHYLNPSAATVFALCDGTMTIAEMASAIAGTYDQPADEVEAQVRSLLRELRKLGLLLPSRRKAGESPEVTAVEDRRRTVRVQVPKNT